MCASQSAKSSTKSSTKFPAPALKFELPGLALGVYPALSPPLLPLLSATTTSIARTTTGTANGQQHCPLPLAPHHSLCHYSVLRYARLPPTASASSTHILFPSSVSLRLLLLLCAAAATTRNITVIPLTDNQHQYVCYSTHLLLCHSQRLLSVRDSSVLSSSCAIIERVTR